jgi:caffeoyl-CoA O-methyltransferase
MLNLVNEKIERYAEALSSPESKLFKALARVTRQKTKWPQMQVGHLEGLFLKLLVRITRAKRVLEIGTFTGYSALAMAEGLPPRGRLITLDIDPVNTEIAREFWKKAPGNTPVGRAGRKISLNLGPALKTLKTLRGPFDLVFIDADKENYIKYWQACIPMLHSGGLMVVDNVLWSGRVLKPKDAIDRAIVAFNRHAQKDRRVELVMLTVRDGVTLAVKK